MSVNEDGYTEDNGFYNPLSKFRRKRALDLKLLTEGLRCLPNLSDTQVTIHILKAKALYNLKNMLSYLTCYDKHTYWSFLE